MSSSTSGNFIAALASFFVPGLGQLIQGRIIAALVFFVVSVGLWFFFLVGLGISWLVSKPPFGGADSRSSGKRDGCGALKLCLSGIRTGIAVETALRTLSGAAAEGVIVRCSFGGSFGPPEADGTKVTSPILKPLIAETCLPQDHNAEAYRRKNGGLHVDRERREDGAKPYLR